jgi:hypothetical protein
MFWFGELLLRLCSSGSCSLAHLFRDPQDLPITELEPTLVLLGRRTTVVSSMEYLGAPGLLHLFAESSQADLLLHSQVPGLPQAGGTPHHSCFLRTLLTPLLAYRRTSSSSAPRRLLALSLSRCSSVVDGRREPEDAALSTLAIPSTPLASLNTRRTRLSRPPPPPLSRRRPFPFSHHRSPLLLSLCIPSHSSKLLSLESYMFKQCQP